MVNHAERLATIYVIITNKCISSQTMYHYILYLKLKNALYYFFCRRDLTWRKGTLKPLQDVFSRKLALSFFIINRLDIV